MVLIQVMMSVTQEDTIPRTLRDRFAQWVPVLVTGLLVVASAAALLRRPKHNLAPASRLHEPLGAM